MLVGWGAGLMGSPWGKGGNKRGNSKYGEQHVQKEEGLKNQF